MNLSRKPASRLAGALVLWAFLPLIAGCGNPDAVAEARGERAATAAADQENRRQAIDLAALGFNEGDEEGAPVRVIEFSDFGCIHCASFHLESYHQLHREFIETGDVVWKYVPITIGGFPNGNRAAITGECAGAQGRFPRMRDHLFEHREEWLGSDAPDPLFRSYAERTGLDMTAFDTCYAGSGAGDRIAAGNRIAQELGIRGTPTFVVQGFPVAGAPPIDQFREALRQLVTEARSPGGA